MPNKNGRNKLVREDEPSQRTEQGLEIPVPEREQVMDVLNKATRKREPSRSAKGKRRTSRGDR